MGIGKDRTVGRQLRTFFNVGAIGELSDGQLLERFATDRGEVAELAFAALVERHGPMVLRVCRGVLDDPHDSQDAFQATFLVLVAKVREAIVDQLVSGLRARIKFDAFPDAELVGGVVVSIAPLPDPATRFADDRKVYTTFVNLKKGLPGLRPGMAARVEILVKELDNVLSVPIASVIGIDEKDLVAVKTPTGAIEWRTVTLGMSNDKSVEVKNGLQAGDLVILDPAAHMSEEMKRKNKYPTKPAAEPGTP